MRRGGEIFLWSRGEELVTDRFPELIQAAARLPDGVVLDGEVLAWDAGVLPFAVLQRRIGRDRLTQRLLQDAPVAFLAYDLLEEGGIDLRALPFAERRARLEKLVEVSDAPAGLAGGSRRELGRAGGVARRRARAPGRGADAEAP